MTIDVYSATGTKKGTRELPEYLFGGRINIDLMHQVVVLQQSNRRAAIAHVKTRAEVTGSTKKAYDQKHTGRARRGSVRSPLLRGGGKAFGPRNDANFIKDMPRAMRRSALISCLSLQAKKGAIIGLEDYPETIKTKTFHSLLQKLPVDIGRRLLFVVPARHESLWKSSRNIPRVKVIQAGYLNPEDILLARSIIFVGNSLDKAAEVFGKREARPTGGASDEATPAAPKKVKTPKAPKAAKAPAKKPTPLRSSASSSAGQEKAAKSAPSA